MFDIFHSILLTCCIFTISMSLIRFSLPHILFTIHFVICNTNIYRCDAFISKHSENFIHRVEPSFSIDSNLTEFWTNVRNAKQVGNMIDFQVPIFGFERFPSKLYVRPCYEDLWDDISSNTCHYLIQGSPGIGKSMFSVYLLWRFAKQIQPPNYIIWAFKGIGKAGAFFIDGRCLRISVNNLENWFLSHERAALILVDGVEPLLSDGRCIVNASPNSAPKIGVIHEER